jgi:hypothetical protein
VVRLTPGKSYPLLNKSKEWLSRFFDTSLVRDPPDHTSMSGVEQHTRRADQSHLSWATI